jgi:hypothetical protein
LALFLFIIITFSIITKGVTHLFTLGYLPSPIFRNLLPHEGVVPSVEDDFGVVLLKLGTACIESTQYAGLRNELAGIEERHGPWVELDARDSSVVKHGMKGASSGFGMEITDIDVAELESPAEGQSERGKELRAFGSACSRFVVAITINAVMATPVGRWIVRSSIRLWKRRWWYGPREWKFWRRQAWAEPARFRERRVERQDRSNSAIPAARTTGRETAGRDLRRRFRSASATPGPSSDIRDTYAAFLTGTAEIEGDEEDWEDRTDGESNSESEFTETDDEEERDLYRDLIVKEDEDTDALQPVLLAHITSGTPGPLTRTRYNAILATPTRSVVPTAGMMEIVSERREIMGSSVTGRKDDWDDDRRRCCVVCTVEPRDTILWPCRCV